MLDPAVALAKIKRWAGFHTAGGLTDEEMVNCFLTTVIEAPLSATADCLAALPLSIRSLTLRFLTEFAKRDYYDDRHAYINDGLTVEERRRHYHEMQPHYRAIGEYLLSQL